MTDAASASLLEMTKDIVAAYVTKNVLAASELPAFIRAMHAALSEAETGNIPKPRPEPPVPIRKSVQRDYIVCLEDGKTFQSLKRHLQTRYNLTPQEYRDRWGLPADYPMVAPSYSEKRSELAKKHKLGRKPRG